MSEAPETIWARRHETGVVEAADYKIEGEQEYRRTDLPATDEQAFANEKVKALMEALQYYNTSGYEGKEARAALAAMETEE